jgi:hypothetical protein
VEEVAEEAVKSSNLNYTIIRPGGLLSAVMLNSNLCVSFVTLQHEDVPFLACNSFLVEKRNKISRIIGDYLRIRQFQQPVFSFFNPFETLLEGFG